MVKKNIVRGMPNISYSAVVLTETSRNKLLTKFKSDIPKGWRIICHHMTICLGELPFGMKDNIGDIVKLTVTHIGKSEKAIALKVNGYYSKNKIPHITLAIPIEGRPKDSNEIQDWFPVQNINISGVVQEIENKQKLTESLLYKIVKQEYKKLNL